MTIHKILQSPQFTQLIYDKLTDSDFALGEVIFDIFHPSTFKRYFLIFKIERLIRSSLNNQKCLCTNLLCTNNSNINCIIDEKHELIAILCCSK